MKSPQTSTAVNAMKPVGASGGSIVANFDVLDNGEDDAGRTNYSCAAGVLDLGGGACAWGCAGAASGVAMEML